MIAVSAVKGMFESVLQCIPLSKIFISYLQIAAPLGAYCYFVKFLYFEQNISFLPEF
jgi:hypothetical protein